MQKMLVFRAKRVMLNGFPNELSSWRIAFCSYCSTLVVGINFADVGKLKICYEAFFS